ncbi:recombinase family protein [Fibrisoma limi]|uniref:recombinase family protein n=1 Tax=Fibrisoma limi TaxID=663275 RepID=UPI0021D0B05C|nr:recombinase family protein [Fibrisoma limi]
MGHACVSTINQNLDLQINALQRADGEQVLQETISGSTTQRRELSKLSAQLRHEASIDQLEL